MAAPRGSWDGARCAVTTATTPWLRGQTPPSAGPRCSWPVARTPVDYILGSDESSETRDAAQFEPALHREQTSLEERDGHAQGALLLVQVGASAAAPQPPKAVSVLGTPPVSFAWRPHFSCSRVRMNRLRKLVKSSMVSQQAPTQTRTNYARPQKPPPYPTQPVLVMVPIQRFWSQCPKIGTTARCFTHQLQCRFTARLQATSEPFHNVLAVLPSSFAQHCEPPAHRLRINSTTRTPPQSNKLSHKACAVKCVRAFVTFVTDNKPTSFSQHAPLLRRSCAQTTAAPHGGIHTASAVQCTVLNFVSSQLQGDGAFEAQAPKVLQALSSNQIPQRGQTSWPCVCREATSLLPHVHEITALWRRGQVQLCISLGKHIGQLVSLPMHPAFVVTLMVGLSNVDSNLACAHLAIRLGQFGGDPSPCSRSTASCPTPPRRAQVSLHRPRPDSRPRQ